MNKFPHNSRHSGFILPVGMVMLIVLSIIGVSTMRDGILQEKMSSNYLDKEKSFQGAESALRMVQRITLRTSVEDISATANFHSTAADPLGAPDYESIDLNAVGFQVLGVKNPGNDHLADHPVAMLEEMINTESLKVGKAPTNKELAKRFFRITTLSPGETVTATTTLQGVVSR